MGQSAITYCSGVKHAESVAELYNEHGITAAVLSGDSTPTEREDILAKYESGEIKVLCNAKLLIEGFDQPRASVGLNLHPTLSAVDAEQRAGRVLRLDKNNPDKWAFIVDFIDKNSQIAPITFAEIAGVSEATMDTEDVEDPNVTSRSRSGRSGSRGSSLTVDALEAILQKKILIKGLKVIIDTKEVLEISKNFSSQHENLKSKEAKIWSIDELKILVANAGIKSTFQYSAFRLKINENEDRPPKMETIMKLPGFSGWDNFFGKEKKKKFTFEELKKEVKEKGVTGSDQYRALSSKYGWPHHEALSHWPEFTNWTDFLDKKLDFEKLKKEVQEKGIKSSNEYLKARVGTSWPTIESMVHNGFDNNWDEFFGREKFDIEKLKKEVREKGIKNRTQYAAQAPANKWPA